MYINFRKFDFTCIPMKCISKERLYCDYHLQIREIVPGSDDLAEYFEEESIGEQDDFMEHF